MAGLSIGFSKMKQIKLKFKTLTDSKSVTLTLKNNESEPREQMIVIKPNDEIYFLENYEFYSPNQKFTKNHQRESIKSNQVFITCTDKILVEDKNNTNKIKNQNFYHMFPKK